MVYKYGLRMSPPGVLEVRLNMIKYIPPIQGYLSLPQSVYYLSLCLPVAEEDISSAGGAYKALKIPYTQLESMLTHRGVMLQAIFVQMLNVLPLDKTL
jgi:hypothetical protein